MGIHGLIPAAIITQDQQMERVMVNFRSRATDVDRYIYLNALAERNERLFYRCLVEHTEEMMPIVYTPTVGKACQLYGTIYRKPRWVNDVNVLIRGQIYSYLSYVLCQLCKVGMHT